MKTHVYRLRDADDRLLYVGVSKNVVQRLHQHAVSKQKPWWFRVASIELQPFDDGEAALRAEAAAIKAEQPQHNVQGNPARPSYAYSITEETR